MPRLTRAQRAEVVELLRCAADGRGHGRGLVMAGYATGHVDGIKPCTPIYLLACDAYMEINRIPSEWYWSSYRRRIGLLEAAARVEEGRWP
jgi:hypothetical protein